MRLTAASGLLALARAGRWHRRPIRWSQFAPLLVASPFGGYCRWFFRSHALFL